jgi:hypothetical protein
MSSPPRSKRFSTFLFLLGIACLCYVLGAAAMFFELPSSGYLGKAFVGLRAWNERREVVSQIVDQKPPRLSKHKIDKPEKTFDGFTLCTFVSTTTSSTQAILVDMRGEVVHRWAIPFSRVWSKPPHLSVSVHDSLVCIFGTHLYDNGDLLIVFHGLESASNGYGLVKLDKDSNIVWSYAARVHHDVDVGEDGTIYAVKHDVLDVAPKGLEFIATPFLSDYLVLLSPEGKELRKPISLVEAFRDSPYALLLSPHERAKRHGSLPGAPSDFLHTNCVQVLGREIASKFPYFKKGHVLISLREIDTLAMLDPQSGVISWATQGLWRRQHDAHFLDNGHLLLFDNLGSPRSSRVLEYDPKSQAFLWSYPSETGTPFVSKERGMSQRLPNGNTLIVNSEGHELMEVTSEKEVVWSCTFDSFISSGRRYSPSQLTFLKGGTRARP